MQKLKSKFMIVLTAFFVSLVLMFMPIAADAESEEVYLGGMPAGFTLGIGGAQVVGICEVLTENGVINPAKDADLAVGDVIVTFDGIKITAAADIDGALACYKGGCAKLTIERGKERLNKEISPAKDMASGKYKLGILIRDSVAGIGTVTYIRQDGRFGSLGHPVSAADGSFMQINDGAMFNCSIVNVVRGERGKAGELKGLFLNDKRIATADKNCATGIFGTVEKDCDFSSMSKVAVSNDAEPGSAVIYTTVDGVSPKEYSISIIKVDKNNKQNKNFVIKITDKKLLDATGGIVQGMSGSPIVQNGKLIGAVTHVFINDPTRGYGTCISNMICN